MDLQNREFAFAIHSEAEYHDATVRLANELLRENTPEQLAQIAAQHIIYVDALEVRRDSLEETQAVKDKLIDTLNALNAEKDQRHQDQTKRFRRINEMLLLLIEERKKQADLRADHDKAIASLFEPVTKAQLEAMFPDNGRWDVYAERQGRNGLKVAANVSRAKFNPYHAAKWWIDTQSPAGWKWERCLRVLANNLPTRSLNSKHLLTGGFD